MDLACNTLYSDNEENVSICLKLAIELHRNFRANMEPKAPVLMEFVKGVCSLELFSAIVNSLSTILKAEGMILITAHRLMVAKQLRKIIPR